MKLTIHDACWEAAASPWSDKALAAGVGWLKVIDDPARAYAVAERYPGCNVIYRKVAPSDIEQLSDLRRHPEFGDPKACAEMFLRLADIRTAVNLWVEGANEVKLATEDDARWYGEVEARRSRLLAARGLRAVIGNFATGNPTAGMFQAFMKAYAAHDGDRAALIGLHEYGAINLPAVQDGHNLLRHRMLRGFATGYRWAITECGLDRVQIGGVWVGGGWRSVGMSERDYWEYLADFARELDRDVDVVCACVFTYGDTARWKDFEMNDANDFNGALVDRLSRAQADDWTHTVSATLGLNVRTEPNYNAPKSAPAMPNGQRVRVIGWSDGREWALINYPASGWCFAANLKERLQEPAPPALVVTPGPAMRLEKGARFVDVSAYQPPAEMDYPVLELHGYSLVMARVAVGLKEDPTWREHVRLGTSAGMGAILYSVFSFTVGWKDQADFLLGILRTLPGCPTVALDLELPNPTKATADLRLYTQVLRAAGVPLAAYTRKTWVDENLSDWGFLSDLPLVAAHYRRPIDAAPWAPAGWPATAWQHVAGERVVSDKMYWGLAKTMLGKFIDESLVVAPWDVRTFG